MEFIDNFEAHYDYDCTYLRKMAQSSPKGFKIFTDFMPMGQYSKAVQADLIWIARISAMLTEDCGACVQLNIKMAIEAGVSKDIVRATVKDPGDLSEKQRLVFDYSKAVAKNESEHFELFKQMEKEYTQEELIELGLAIAATRVYPTIKRALGEFKSCSLYDFEF